MANSSKSSLYDKVVRVTHVYLGPAAKRFIDRQIENHLHETPDELSQADLLSLIDWIKVVVSLLTDDSEIVAEYIQELHKLAGQPDKFKPSKDGAKNG